MQVPVRWSEVGYDVVGAMLIGGVAQGDFGKVISWLMVDNQLIEDINSLSYFPTGSEVVFESTSELLIWGEFREIIIKNFNIFIKI